MSHAHHHHGHHHGHDHGHHDDGAPEKGGWLGRRARFFAAFALAALALASACLVLVGPGQAIVLTRFGDPARVLTRPGLAFRMPAPIENIVDVDLRLRTTSSGLLDVGTKDGLRILVQAYMAWQVPGDADHVRQFLRAVRNQPDVAADQLRGFLNSSLEIVASGFDLASLVNTDPSKIQLEQFERRARERLDEQSLRVYGVNVRQVGLERLTLPAEALNATVERMRAERAVVAAERQAEGQRAAAEINSNAERDARILVAKSRAEAADIDAKSRVEAADIYGKAFGGDPKLYTLLRSLDTLGAVIGPNTRVILRTDAAPFRALVDGVAAPAPGPAAGGTP